MAISRSRSPSPNPLRRSSTSFAHSKENDKSLPPRSRSPVVKSFMAPTISAASKVTAPPQRRRILQERNEPAPAPLSVPKETVPAIGLKFKMGRGAEPSEPPYDPKTNYLSPRPQFLHYKPNALIERDGRKLEELFSSESDSDITDGNDVCEEKAFEEVEEHLDEKAHVDEYVDEKVTDFETTDASSDVVEEHSGFDAKEDVDEKVDPNTDAVVETESESETIEPPRSSRRSKLLPFLLFLLVAGCASVPLSGFYSPSSMLLEDLCIHDYIVVANVKMHELASELKQLSSNAIARLTSSENYPSDVGFVTTVNLTLIDENEGVSSGFVYRHGDDNTQAVREIARTDFASEVEDNEMEDVYEVESADMKKAQHSDFVEDEMDAEVPDRVEAMVEEFETAIIVEEESSDIHEESIAEYVGSPENDATDVKEEASDKDTESIVAGTEVEEATCEQEAESLPGDSVTEIHDIAATDIMDSESAEVTVTEVLDNAATDIKEAATEEDTESLVEEFDNAATAIEEESVQADQGLIEEADESTAEVSTQVSSMNYQAISAVASALILILGVAMFLHAKPKKAATVVKKTNGDSYTPVNASRRTRTQSDACSSLSNTYHTRLSEEEDVSNERRLRRDSTASSVSYGSFTTYERITAKKGTREEEVVTPVRRSSRLNRSQVSHS